MVGKVGETTGVVPSDNVQRVNSRGELRCIRGAEEGARIIEGRPAVVAWMERVEAATAKPV